MKRLGWPLARVGPHPSCPLARAASPPTLPARVSGCHHGRAGLVCMGIVTAEHPPRVVLQVGDPAGRHRCYADPRPCGKCGAYLAKRRGGMLRKRGGGVWLGAADRRRALLAEARGRDRVIGPAGCPCRARRRHACRPVAGTGGAALATRCLCRCARGGRAIPTRCRFVPRALRHRRGTGELRREQPTCPCLIRCT